MTLSQTGNEQMQTGTPIICHAEGSESYTKYGKDFKPQLVIRGKDGHLILLKGALYQEDKRIINT